MTQKYKPCVDSDGLGYGGNDKLVVGFVSEINGPDSVEISDFVPTRHETIQLVKYWHTTDLGHRFYFFVCGQTGSTEWRVSEFACRRIDRIAKLLGEEEVRKAIQEAEEQFSKRTDPKTWAIFMNGTREEQEAFQDELQRELDWCEEHEKMFYDQHADPKRPYGEMLTARCPDEE